MECSGLSAAAASLAPQVSSRCLWSNSFLWSNSEHPKPHIPRDQEEPVLGDVLTLAFQTRRHVPTLEQPVGCNSSPPMCPCLCLGSGGHRSKCAQAPLSIASLSSPVCETASSQLALGASCALDHAKGQCPPCQVLRSVKWKFGQSRGCHQETCTYSAQPARD